MNIQLPDDTEQLSVAAGYASVDQFVLNLLHRERERLAIQAGINSLEQGNVSDFEEFDKDFRSRNGLNSD
jgi:hypothetical protein